MDVYLDSLRNKNVALMCNHTSMVGERHLVDTLLELGIQLSKIFSPEHSYRGDRADGERIGDEIDPETGIPVISLYGKKYKADARDLEGIDLVLYDIQDLGVRFYTYISSLHYLMESTAEQDIPLMVLDRPNPHAGYVDGPVLETEFRSFIGMHPIPVVYGLTVGELAGMINGEGWLKDGMECNLKVIPVSLYKRDSCIDIKVYPSPNLRSMNAMYLYPSLAFFEGTAVSEGRGTWTPFEIFGHPKMKNKEFSFVPRSIPGLSHQPQHLGDICYGVDLRDYITRHPCGQQKLILQWLLEAYKELSDKTDFFREDYFDLLAGTDQLRKQIIEGATEQEIRASWEEGIAEYRELRKRYLIYK